MFKLATPSARRRQQERQQHQQLNRSTPGDIFRAGHEHLLGPSGKSPGGQHLEPLYKHKHKSNAKSSSIDLISRANCYSKQPLLVELGPVKVANELPEESANSFDQCQLTAATEESKSKNKKDKTLDTKTGKLSKSCQKEGELIIDFLQTTATQTSTTNRVLAKWDSCVRLLAGGRQPSFWWDETSHFDGADQLEQSAGCASGHQLAHQAPQLANDEGSLECLSLGLGANGRRQDQPAAAVSVLPLPSLESSAEAPGRAGVGQRLGSASSSPSLLGPAPTFGFQLDNGATRRPGLGQARRRSHLAPTAFGQVRQATGKSVPTKRLVSRRRAASIGGQVTPWPAASGGASPDAAPAKTMGGRQWPGPIVCRVSASEQPAEAAAAATTTTMCQQVAEEEAERQAAEQLATGAELFGQVSCSCFRCCSGDQSSRCRCAAAAAKGQASKCLPRPQLVAIEWPRKHGPWASVAEPSGASCSLLEAAYNANESRRAGGSQSVEFENASGRQPMVEELNLAARRLASSLAGPFGGHSASYKVTTCARHKQDKTPAQAPNKCQAVIYTAATTTTTETTATASQTSGQPAAGARPEAEPAHGRAAGRTGGGVGGAGGASLVHFKSGQRAQRVSRPGRSPVSLQSQTNAKLARHRLKIQQQRQEQLANFAAKQAKQATQARQPARWPPVASQRSRVFASSSSRGAHDGDATQTQTQTETHNISRQHQQQQVSPQAANASAIEHICIIDTLNEPSSSGQNSAIASTRNASNVATKRYVGLTSRAAYDELQASQTNASQPTPQSGSLLHTGSAALALIGHLFGRAPLGKLASSGGQAAHRRHQAIADIAGAGQVNQPTELFHHLAIDASRRQVPSYATVEIDCARDQPPVNANSGRPNQQSATTQAATATAPSARSGRNVIAFRSINMLRNLSSSSSSAARRFRANNNYDHEGDATCCSTSSSNLSIGTTCSSSSFDSLNEANGTGKSWAYNNGRPFCKICHMGSSRSNAHDKLISPCKCSGTMQFVHCGCLLKWLEISNRAQEKPMSCELCSHEYTWHKRFNYKQIRLPQCSIKDTMLHLIFVLALAGMLFCALAPMFSDLATNATASKTLSAQTLAISSSIQPAINANNQAANEMGSNHISTQDASIRQSPYRRPSSFGNSGGGGGYHTQQMASGRLGNDEKFILLCVACFFLSFFLAIYVQTKARNTLYGLIVDFMSINQTYYITEYDHDHAGSANATAGGGGGAVASDQQQNGGMSNSTNGGAGRPSSNSNNANCAGDNNADDASQTSNRNNSNRANRSGGDRESNIINNVDGVNGDSMVTSNPMPVAFHGTRNVAAATTKVPHGSQQVFSGASRTTSTKRNQQQQYLNASNQNGPQLDHQAQTNNHQQPASDDHQYCS